VSVRQAHLFLGLIATANNPLEPFLQTLYNTGLRVKSRSISILDFSLRTCTYNAIYIVGNCTQNWALCGIIARYSLEKNRERLI
jgi:hypothetical protein